MDSILTFTWDFGKGIEFGSYTLRFYSILFALGFVFGYQLMKKMFIKEKVSLDKLESLVVYMVVATVVGARLGHVFFYQWDYYSQHIGEIFMVWQGGLASHGAAIAIVFSVYLFSKKVFKDPKRTLWVLDRVVIVIALAGTLIRLGNWFNSEIYGAMANSSLETVFTEPTRERLMAVHAKDIIDEISFKNTGERHATDSLDLAVYDMSVQFINVQLPQDQEKLEFTMLSQMKQHLDNFKKEDMNILIPTDSRVEWDASKANLAHVKVLAIPRHPTQIYESLGYFIIFLILYFAYQNTTVGQRRGYLFGAFLVLIFGFRFFIEYMKENQVSSEEGQLLNIGQYLSIPLVLAGIYFMVSSKNKINESKA